MKRRRLLSGLCALAVGGSLTVATGAFTGVDAGRGVAVTVAADEEALLHLVPLGTGDDGFPAARANEDGRIEVAIPGADGRADGVGTDGVYRFDGVLRATNHGTRRIDLYGEYGGTALAALAVYDSSGPRTPLDGPARAVELDVGESVDLGLHVDTRGSATGRYDETLSIVAGGDA